MWELGESWESGNWSWDLLRDVIVSILSSLYSKYLTQLTFKLAGKNLISPNFVGLIWARIMPNFWTNDP